MADYDIFRDQLAIKYPSYGHALWEPSPRISDRPVQVGDVGFIRRGKFHRLFNALLPADDPSQERGVPEYHEPLVPTSPDHLDTGFLGQNDLCSSGISVEPDPGYHSLGPDDFPKVSFQSNRTRGAAVLSLPVAAWREDTLAQGDFKRWIVKHIDSWIAFARKLGLGIDQMEEIILVTGYHRTRSWANIAFLGNHVDAQVTFGVKVEGPDTGINFQFSRGNARGAVLRLGPEGKNLPENQCVFIRGFRVARSFWKLGRHIKAAAGPSPDLGGYDCDPDAEVISIPADTKYRDPLYLLLEYIAEQASDCDMVIAHDDDLVTIDGLGHDASLETLEPDVMMDLLRRSNIEIDYVSYDLPPTDGGPNTDTSVVKVAMVSMKSQNWTENVDLGHTSESRVSSPPPVPDGFPPITIRGDTSKPETSQTADDGDGAPSKQQDSTDSTLRELGDTTEEILLALGKIRNSPSNVWSSLSEFLHVERKVLLTAFIAICCAVSLLRWIYLFTWDFFFKLAPSLFLAGFPLYVWFEREYTYRRPLDDIYARVESLQHHVASLQLSPAATAVVDDVRGCFPVIAKATPAGLMSGRSNIEDIIQPAIPEINIRYPDMIGQSRVEGIIQPSISEITRHGDYFLAEGDVTFKVENTLFRVHKLFFLRESSRFRSLLRAPCNDPPGSSETNPIVLEDTTSEAFAALCWIFYNPKYSTYTAPVEKWVEILALAQKWEFKEVEQFCIRQLEKLPIPPVEKIHICHTLHLDQSLLIHPFEELTLRPEPLTLEEGRKLGMETALQIAVARERSRNTKLSTIQVNDSDLRSVIQDVLGVKWTIEPIDEPAEFAPTSPALRQSKNRKLKKN